MSDYFEELTEELWIRELLEEDGEGATVNPIGTFTPPPTLSVRAPSTSRTAPSPSRGSSSSSSIAVGMKFGNLTKLSNRLEINPGVLNLVTGLRAKHKGWLLKLLGFMGAWNVEYLKWNKKRRKFHWLDRSGKTTDSWGNTHCEPPGFGADTAFLWPRKLYLNTGQLNWKIGAKPAILAFDCLASSTNYSNFGEYTFLNTHHFPQWGGAGITETTLYNHVFNNKGTLRWPPEGARSTHGLMSEAQYLDRAREYYLCGIGLVHTAECYRIAKGDIHPSIEWTLHAMSWGIPVCTASRMMTRKRFVMGRNKDIPEIDIPASDMCKLVMSMTPPPGSIPSGWEVGGHGTHQVKRPVLDWPKDTLGITRPYVDGIGYIYKLDGNHDYDKEDYRQWWAEQMSKLRSNDSAKYAAKWEKWFNILASVLFSVVAMPASPLVGAALNMAIAALRMFSAMADGEMPSTVMLKRILALAGDVVGAKLGLDDFEAIEVFSDGLDTIKDTLKWDYITDLYGDAVELIQGGEATQEKIADAFKDLVD